MFLQPMMTIGIVTASETALASCDALFDGLVRAVGIGAFKVQTQEICALHRLGTLGHVNHGLAAGVERLLTGHRVLGHAEVRQLNADLRSVLDFCIERVERQYVSDRRLQLLCRQRPAQLH